MHYNDARSLRHPQREQDRCAMSEVSPGHLGCLPDKLKRDWISVIDRVEFDWKPWGKQLHEFVNLLCSPASYDSCRTGKEYSNKGQKV